jgi:hypothetical protein
MYEREICETSQETQVDTKFIECKLIDNPKVDKELRTFNKEFATNLAQSIQAEGMYNPIVLRPHPTDPGRFIVVQGTHRLFATAKVLKLPIIEAKVFDDMDEADAEMAMLSENLWRNPLKKEQHLIALNKWWQHWKTKNPEKVGSGGARRGQSVTKQAPATEGQTADVVEGAGVEAEPAAAEEAKSAKFEEMVAAATGKSVSSAKRDTRIAKAFDAEQLEALHQMKATQADMIRLAKVKDEGKRGEIVNLIASGMEVDDAFADALGAEAPAATYSKTKEAEATAAAEPGESGMTDDEWFETYCGAKAALLKDPTKFKADALLFRATSDLRQSFRSKAKKHVAATKKGGVTGLFYSLLNRMCSMSHPKDWLLCEGCLGAGTTGEGEAKCSKCFGGGYHLRTETFV